MLQDLECPENFKIASKLLAAVASLKDLLKLILAGSPWILQLLLEHGEAQRAIPW